MVMGFLNHIVVATANPGTLFKTHVERIRVLTFSKDMD